MDDHELTDLELLHEVMALSVRQRSILQLAERRAAHRELNARSQREARERTRKGASPLREDAPQDDEAA